MREKRVMRDEGISAKTGISWLLTAGGVISVVVALVVYMSFRPEIEPSDADLTALIPPDASVPEAPPVAVPADAPETPAEVRTQMVFAPSVEEVRLEADGVAVIAGRAEPGSTVRVLVDGKEIASAVADASGSFAAVGFVAPGDTVRVLSLLSTGDGEMLASLDDIILAPTGTEQPAQDDLGRAPATAGATDDGAPTGVTDDAATDDAATDDAATAQQAGIGSAASAAAGEQIGPDPVPEEGFEATAFLDGSDAAALKSAPAANEAAEVAQVAPATGQPAAESKEAATEPPTSEAGEAPAVAVLRSTADGVTLLQPTAPVAEQIELDTIGYSSLGNVQLSGRADLDAVEVRIYVNNRSVASLPVDTQGGWRGDLPDVDAGVYTLRVDAVDADGKVTSRIETPFQREAPEALAAAAQAGAVTAVTVQTGDTLWAIARDRYGEGVLFVKVFEANRGAIRDPDLIYPGQVFDLPDQ